MPVASPRARIVRLSFLIMVVSFEGGCLAGESDGKLGRFQERNPPGWRRVARRVRSEKDVHTSDQCILIFFVVLGDELVETVVHSKLHVLNGEELDTEVPALLAIPPVRDGR